MTFAAGAEGAYSGKGEEAHSSPGPAGQEWQLCQLLLKLWWWTSQQHEEHAQKGSCKGQFRRSSHETCSALKVNFLVINQFSFMFPSLSFAGLFQTEPRAIRSGGLLQKCPLPWLWKSIRKTSKWNVLLLWEWGPQAHQRHGYSSGNNCILTW